MCCNGSSSKFFPLTILKKINLTKETKTKMIEAIFAMEKKSKIWIIKTNQVHGQEIGVLNIYIMIKYLMNFC